MNICLWNYLTKMKLLNALLNLFRNLTAQGEDMKKYCNRSNKIHSLLFICLFIIWMFSSMIISKSLTELLLKTFFIIKFEPLVRTLQDIRDNQNILPSVPYIDDVKHSTMVANFYLDDILERSNKTEQMSRPYNYIEQVINANIVMLYSTRQTRTFMDMAKPYESKIHVSDSKYMPGYSVFFISNHRQFTKLMVF